MNGRRPGVDGRTLAARRSQAESRRALNVSGTLDEHRRETRAHLSTSVLAQLAVIRELDRNRLSGNLIDFQGICRRRRTAFAGVRGRQRSGWVLSSPRQRWRVCRRRRADSSIVVVGIAKPSPRTTRMCPAARLEFSCAGTSPSNPLTSSASSSAPNRTDGRAGRVLGA